MVSNYDEVIDRTHTDSIKWNPITIEKWFKLKDQLPLWVADMDFRVPPEVIESIIERAKHGIFGYAAAGDEYYQSIIDWFYNRHAWKIEKDWIKQTPGVVPAINFIIQTFSRPGDKILIQEPVYYPFRSSIEGNGRIVVVNELQETENRYSIDFEDFEKKIKQSRVRIFILCSPHNPVGRVWTKSELLKMGEICLENNVLIIADEIHCDLIMPGYKHTPFASLSEKLAQNSIVCTAASKTFNLAGLHASNIIIPNKEIRRQFNITLENLGLMGLNIFGRLSVEVAYQKGESWLDETLTYISQNYSFLCEYMAENLPEVRISPMEGTYLAWVDYNPLGIDSKTLDHLIKHEANVLLDDGSMFGESGKGFQRFNLACPRSILKEALDKITQACVDHRKLINNV